MTAAPARQREHVMAQVKHFVANNQEINRFGNPLGLPLLSPAVNVIVSERALQEIYYPAEPRVELTGNNPSAIARLIAPATGGVENHWGPRNFRPRNFS